MLLTGCIKEISEQPVKVGCMVTHKQNMNNNGQPMRVLEVKHNSARTYNTNNVSQQGSKYNRGSVARYSYQVRVSERQWYYLSAMNNYQCPDDKTPVSLITLNR
jgi:hypothetical protein